MLGLKLIHKGLRRAKGVYFEYFGEYWQCYNGTILCPEVPTKNTSVDIDARRHDVSVKQSNLR